MGEQLTREQVEAMDALEKKALPAPWDSKVLQDYRLCPHDDDTPYIYGPNDTKVMMGLWPIHGPKPEDTAEAERQTFATIELVAALRNAWPLLRDLALRGLDAQRVEHPPCLCARMPKETCAWPECNLGREHRQDAASRNNAATIAAPESYPPTVSDNLARSHIEPSSAPVVPTAVEEIGKKLDSLLPLPSRMHDMDARDYELYIKLAEIFWPLVKRAEAAESKLEEARRDFAQGARVVSDRLKKGEG